MQIKGFIPLTIILLLSLFISSCATGMKVVEEDWNEEMFFKSAQEAFDEDDLDRALFYYEVFLVRYPSNRQKSVAAEYEIAYIYYKWEEYGKSKDLFQQILDKYENDPFAYMYPRAYKVLSEKVMEKIDQQLAIQELPFFKRSRGERELMGTGRDEAAETEIVRP